METRKWLGANCDQNVALSQVPNPYYSDKLLIFCWTWTVNKYKLWKCPWLKENWWKWKLFKWVNMNSPNKISLDMGRLLWCTKEGRERYVHIMICSFHCSCTTCFSRSILPVLYSVEKILLFWLPGLALLILPGVVGGDVKCVARLAYIIVKFS